MMVLSVYTAGMCLTFPFFTVQNSETLTMSSKPDEGRGRCPYDPYQRNTAIIVGKVMTSQPALRNLLVHCVKSK